MPRAARRPRPLADHERLPARAARSRSSSRPACSGVNVSLDSLARRPLLRADAPRLAAAGARRPRGRRAPPGAAPDQGQRRRAARLHRGRGRALRRARAHASPTRCASSSSCRSTPTARGAATACCPTPRCARLIHAVYPLEPLGRPRHGTARRWRFADGKGEIGFISPVSRAVLRRLQPHPPDRRGHAAHLPVLARRDRPARAAARGRERRRARGDRPRRGVAQGAQAPRQRRRASCSPRASMSQIGG